MRVFLIPDRVSDGACTAAGYFVRLVGPVDGAAVAKDDVGLDDVAAKDDVVPVGPSDDVAAAEDDVVTVGLDDPFSCLYFELGL